MSLGLDFDDGTGTSTISGLSMPEGSSEKVVKKRLRLLDADAGGVSTDKLDMEFVSEGTDDTLLLGDVALLVLPDAERDAPGVGVGGP